MQETQKEQTAKDGKSFYDNDLVVAKADDAPIAASWISSQFGKLFEDLEMPHIRFHFIRQLSIDGVTVCFGYSDEGFGKTAFCSANPLSVKTFHKGFLFGPTMV